MTNIEESFRFCSNEFCLNEPYSMFTLSDTENDIWNETDKSSQWHQ